MKKCKPGYRWCPITKKCKPDTDGRGKGRGKSKGQGKGPIGSPVKEYLSTIQEGAGMVVVGAIASLLVIAAIKDHYDEKKARAIAEEIAPKLSNQIDIYMRKLVPPLMTLGKQIINIINKKEYKYAVDALSIHESVIKNLTDPESYRKSMKSYVFNQIKTIIRYRKHSNVTGQIDTGIFLTDGVETNVEMITAGDDLSERLYYGLKKANIKVENEDMEPTEEYFKHWGYCTKIINEVTAIDKKSLNILKPLAQRIIALTNVAIKQYTIK